MSVFAFDDVPMEQEQALWTVFQTYFCRSEIDGMQISCSLLFLEGAAMGAYMIFTVLLGE